MRRAETPEIGVLGRKAEACIWTSCASDRAGLFNCSSSWLGFVHVSEPSPITCPRPADARRAAPPHVDSAASRLLHYPYNSASLPEYEVAQGMELLEAVIVTDVYADPPRTLPAYA
jgi:hypothetical protein